ncbi:MAG: hypothetical protein ACT4PL_06010, partial [Phycisphaerales bacterium]
APAALAARPPISPGAAPLPPAPPPPPAVSTPSTPWCKHICCVMALIADRLSRDPFLVFALRGLSKEDLLERLRQRRALLTSSRGGAGIPDRPVAAYSPRIPGVGDAPSTALEHLVAEFWQPSADLQHLDLPMIPPEVSHPLLRRLGASPFDEARFPLVGLLATCYEVLSSQALKDAEAGSLEDPLEGEPELDSSEASAAPTGTEIDPPSDDPDAELD